METEEQYIELVKAGDPRAGELLASDSTYASARDAQGVSVVLIAFYHRQPILASLFGAVKKPNLDLFEAAALGEAERVNQLIEAAPVEVDIRSPDGYTALQLASFLGQLETASALVLAGADPNVRSNNSMHVTAMHAALAGGNLEIVQMLLEHGGSAKKAGGGRWTPLHYAAAMGNIELVRELIKRGASPLAHERGGKTPADLANENGHYDIVHELAADVGIGDRG